MKAEKLYPELSRIAGELNIAVLEKSFRNTGIPVKSGLCKVKGQWRFIIDKRDSLPDKCKTLAGYLARFPMTGIEIDPSVKKFMKKYSR